MAIRKLIALGIGAATGYILYRFITQPHEDSPERESKPDPMLERSPVDEASWESFPASDAPALNSARSIT